jgi:hypothetical protein
VDGNRHAGLFVLAVDPFEAEMMRRATEASNPKPADVTLEGGGSSSYWNQ